MAIYPRNPSASTETEILGSDIRPGDTVLYRIHTATVEFDDEGEAAIVLIIDEPALDGAVPYAQILHSRGHRAAMPIVLDAPYIRLDVPNLNPEKSGIRLRHKSAASAQPTRPRATIDTDTGFICEGCGIPINHGVNRHGVTVQSARTEAYEFDDYGDMWHSTCLRKHESQSAATVSGGLSQEDASQPDTEDGLDDFAAFVDDLDDLVDFLSDLDTPSDPIPNTPSKRVRLGRRAPSGASAKPTHPDKSQMPKGHQDSPDAFVKLARRLAKP